MPTPIEIEYKFPVQDLAGIRQALRAIGAGQSQKSFQSDEYLNDPLRDFAKMDIALRIRQSDEQFFLTFKGPNLDSAAKIRNEIETRLVGAKEAEQIKQSFLGIGFYSVASVKKTRETMHLQWQDQQVEVCLDSVADVGDFVELEIVVENPEQKEQAKSALESLASKLELSDSILTSYLELLLQRRGDI